MEVTAQRVGGYGCSGLGGSSASGQVTDGAIRVMDRTSAPPGFGDVADAPAGAAATRPTGRNDGKIDNPWTHGTKLTGQGFICGYCKFTNGGGGATRLRDHLGGIVGEVKSCPSVPRNVRDEMRERRKSTMDDKRDKKERRLSLERDLINGALGGEEVINLEGDEEGQVRMAIRNSLRDKNISHAIDRRSGSSKAVRVSVGKKSVTAYFDKDLARSKAPVQLRIDTALIAGAREILGIAWAKWFHANDIPGLKADCPYFRAAMRLTQQLGTSTTSYIPTSHGIDGEFLQANFEEAEKSLEKFKQGWNQYGVTIMCDSWTGPTGMSIINFMVYCNARMFFHKSIDASDHKQSADFIFKEIRKVVVDEIGPQLVVQIVTDNGSNYKKACERLVEEYKHIFWQPCAAHTINLMLKDIAKFRRVGKVVESAKHICRFLYNHNRLHDEMKKMIGGELIRPNATHFGTVFMFLQSFLDKKDRLRGWMVSKEWMENDWIGDEKYEYTEACLTNSTWWSALKWVVDAVKPLYLLLRYADTQRTSTLSGFKARMMAAIHAMEAELGEGSRQFHRFMTKVTKRVHNIETNTLMIAAAVLDPETHYMHNFSKNPEYAVALTDAFEKMAESHNDVVQAMKELASFRKFSGRFGRPTARSGASSMRPTNWWFQFGGEVPTLQKYALRIVSQCVSSSGCERNWSTFALVHTKIRNKLGYEKLHMLVYVHYNLKERIREDGGEQKEEVDPCAMMLDTAIFDEQNPIWDWLDKSMSDVGPSLYDLYPSLKKNLSSCGRGGKNGNGKRMIEDDEIEIEFEESEDGDEGQEFENDLSDGDHSNEVSVGDDDENEPMDISQRVEDRELSSEGDNPISRRSGRLKQKKMRVDTLYQRK